MKILSKFICLALFILQLTVTARADDAVDDIEKKAQSAAISKLNYQIFNAKDQMEQLQEDYDAAKTYCAQNPNDPDCSDEFGYYGGAIKDYENYQKEYNDYKQNSQQYIQQYKEKNIETETARKELLNIIEDGKKNGATISPEMENFIKSTGNLNELNKRKDKLTKDIAFQTSPEGIEKKRLDKKYNDTYKELTGKLMRDDDKTSLWKAQDDAAAAIEICAARGSIDEKCLDQVRAEHGLKDYEQTTETPKEEKNTETGTTTESEKPTEENTDANQEDEKIAENTDETSDTIPAEQISESSSGENTENNEEKIPAQGISSNDVPSDNEITGCSSDYGLFSGLIQTGRTVFAGLRDLIYVVAGFGILGVAIGGFFGNLNWKWLGAIVIALVIVASTGEIINLIVGCEQFTKNMITDTLK